MSTENNALPNADELLNHVLSDEKKKEIRNAKLKDAAVATAQVAGKAVLTVLGAAVFGYVLGTTLRASTKPVTITSPDGEPVMEADTVEVSM